MYSADGMINDESEPPTPPVMDKMSPKPSPPDTPSSLSRSTTMVEKASRPRESKVWGQASSVSLRFPVDIFTKLNISHAY